MHKIDGDQHQNGRFVSEDAKHGQGATQITPEWLNAVQEELVNAIQGGAQNLQKADNAQLLAAIRQLIQNWVNERDQQVDGQYAFQKNVGIGTTNPRARLQVVHANQDADGDTLILGPVEQSNLRLGYHEEYSWVQSHGSKPLAINPLGNPVGVKQANPQEMLDVEGNVKAHTFIGDKGKALHMGDKSDAIDSDSSDTVATSKALNTLRAMMLDRAPRAVYVDVTGTGDTSDAWTALTWAHQVYPSNTFRQGDVIRCRHDWTYRYGTGNGSATARTYRIQTFILTSHGWQHMLTQ